MILFDTISMCGRDKSNILKVVKKELKVRVNLSSAWRLFHMQECVTVTKATLETYKNTH